MFHNFASLAASAARYSHEYALDEVSDAELHSRGEPGVVVLIWRCENRLRNLVARAARAGAASLEDLEQAAILGFLESLARDADQAGEGKRPRAAHFTYAYRAIQNALAEANQTASALPLPTRSHKRFWEAMAAMDHDPVKAREWSSLQRLTGRALQDKADEGNLIAADILETRIHRWERKGQTVADMLDYSDDIDRGLTPAAFDAIHSAVKYMSVDSALSTDAEEDAGTLHDVLADEATQVAYADVEDRTTVASLLATLDPRDAGIMRALFGLDDRDGRERTATEVAEEYGISPVRVRGIKASALKALSKVAA